MQNDRIQEFFFFFPSSFMKKIDENEDLNCFVFGEIGISKFSVKGTKLYFQIAFCARLNAPFSNRVLCAP